jgi:mono/diheme cytochrome c family protein
MRPRSFLILCLVGLSIFVLSACGGDSSGAPAADEAVIQRGKLVFQANCSACHSTGSDIVLVGPSLAGIAAKAGDKVVGLDARGFIEQSILEPAAYIEDGFQNMMPDTYGNSLSREDLDAVIAYIMNLK